MLLSKPQPHCTAVELPSCFCWEILEAHPKFFAEHPARLQACQTAVDLMCSACETLGMSWSCHWKTLQSTPGWLCGVTAEQGHPPGHRGLVNVAVSPCLPPSSPPQAAPQGASWVTAAPWNDSLPMEWPSHTPPSLLEQPEQGIAPWQPSTEITLRPRAANMKYLLWWLPPALHSLGMQSAGW